MALIKAVNPWTWQDKLDYSQAIETRGVNRVLYCAGQTSVDGDGNPLHAGNMPAQLDQAFDNLERVLREAGMKLGDVVRLNYYVTDMQAFADAGATVHARLGELPAKPAGTLLQVAGLFHPDIVVEIEATAVV